MRKINPADICDDFRAEIAGLQTFLSDSMGTATSSKNKSLLAELVFHRAYVAVESFISAWIIGAINRDSSQYLCCRKNAVAQSLQAKFSNWDISHLNYSPPAHIPVADLESLLDPDGWNITFKEYARFESRSSEWLAPSFASKVAGVPSQKKRVIDSAKATRNCIAHQSKSSFTEMNSLLGSLPNAGTARHLRTTVNSISNVGAHLKATAGGKTRVDHYLDEFRSFGGDLA